MIFVTVGAQMPFDRMVRIVDDWAARAGRSDVFAQIGYGEYRPETIQYENLLTPTRFRKMATEASLIVSHAGMGTIITALELRKPIIIVPRRADLHETRNDHQIETAKRFGDIRSITVAMDEKELETILAGVCDVADLPEHGEIVCPQLSAGCPCADPAVCRGREVGSACPSLVAAVKMFIHGIK